TAAEKEVGASCMELDNNEVTRRLQSHQLREGWGEEDKKHELPVRLVKFAAGLARYLLVDSKEAASRRARLRLDRSGLRESMARRRLADSPDCPDCKGTPDTAEHVLLQCPSFGAARLACSAELRRLNLQLNLVTALGETEPAAGRPVTEAAHVAALHATAGLLMAIDRIAAKRGRVA